MKFARPVPNNHGGFSLAESLISVGIASSVLLAVIGMLAGTLGGARETRSETVASVLARQLAAEAKEELTNLASGPVASNWRMVMLLDQAMQTLGHSRTDASVLAAWETGDSAPRAAYWGRVELLPPIQAGAAAEEGTTLVTETDAVHRLLVTVEAPAAAPAGARKSHRYVFHVAR